jgi:hypothetical protein
VNDLRRGSQIVAGLLSYSWSAASSTYTNFLTPYANAKWVIGVCPRIRGLNAGEKILQNEDFAKMERQWAFYERNQLLPKKTRSGFDPLARLKQV